MSNPAAKHTDEPRRELAGGPDPKTEDRELREAKP